MKLNLRPGVLSSSAMTARSGLAKAFALDKFGVGDIANFNRGVVGLMSYRAEASKFVTRQRHEIIAPAVFV